MQNLDPQGTLEEMDGWDGMAGDEIQEAKHYPSRHTRAAARQLWIGWRSGSCGLWLVDLSSRESGRPDVGDAGCCGREQCARASIQEPSLSANVNNGFPGKPLNELIKG